MDQFKRDLEVNNAVRVFVKQVEKNRNFTVANKDITYSDFLANRMLIIHAIREGIPYKLLLSSDNIID